MNTLTVLSTITNIITIYILIITLRIIFSWFRTENNNQLIVILKKITDPYLNLFRGIKFLRIGMFDLSAMAGIVLLFIIQAILYEFQYALVSNESISYILIINIILVITWQGISWVIMLLMFLCLIRAGSLFLSKDPSGMFWQVIDKIVQPISNKLERIVKKNLKYTQALIILAFIFLSMRFIGEFFIIQLVQLVYKLPS